ncbi:MAG TPA: transposase domain-containing protein [Blastocatellia bacterium]|nr:transposase domain-containing protein [Blastocatellia bacterium]
MSHQIWVNLQDLLDLDFVFERTARRKIAESKWVTRDAPAPGGRGRPPKQVLLSSLPEDVRTEWTRRASQTAGPISDTQQAATDDRLVKLRQALLRIPAADHPAWIAYAQQIARILEEYSAIQPKFTKDGNGRPSPVPQVIALCKKAVCTHETILKHEPHRAHPPSPRTLYRWLCEFKREGYTAIIRERQFAEPDRDRRRCPLHPDAAAWIDQSWKTFASPKYWCEEALERAKQNGWGDMPSLSWFYRTWREIMPASKTWHLKGKKAFTSLYGLHVMRDLNDLAALEILCGDHRVADVHVVWKDGSLIRPWFTVWQDMRTSLIWGWHLDVTPSSHTIARAYYNGVITWGAQPTFPDRKALIYTDNGKDYKSQNIDGEITPHKLASKIDGTFELILVQRAVGLAPDMQIEQMFARGYNGKEKPIERIFAIMTQWERNKVTGYRGNNTNEIPDSWREMYAKHLKFQKGKLPESPFLTFEQYRNLLEGWIFKYNNSEHERHNLGGARIVPVKEIERLYTRVEVDPEALGLLLMKPVTGSLHKTGIKLPGTPKNWAWWHTALSQFKGVKVGGKKLKFECRVDESNYGHIYVVLPTKPVETMVKAERWGGTSVRNPDKDYVKGVARAISEENRLLREAGAIQASRARGETPEDRIAAVNAEEYELEENEKIAVGQNQAGTIRKLTRMDRLKRLESIPRAKTVSIEDVRAAKVDDSIFENNEPRSELTEELIEEWEA